MKNNFLFNYISIFLFSLGFVNLVKAQEQFSFDVTEIEILIKVTYIKV